jgi:hypothetical protein
MAELSAERRPEPAEHAERRRAGGLVDEEQAVDRARH